MAKRFTATEKWEDPWFCSLTNIEKLFWIYLLDRCDNAGIWQVNWPLVKFFIPDFVYNPETFRNRIVELAGPKWFIPKFIGFQYLTLNAGNRAHVSVIEKLKKEGVYNQNKGHTSPLQGAKDKDKDKDMDKDKVKDKDKTYVIPDKATDPNGFLVWTYKKGLGVAPDDREWDKQFWARWAKQAKIIIEAVGGIDNAISFLQHWGHDFTDKGLNWTLRTIADKAVSWAAKQRGKANDASNRTGVFDPHAHTGPDKTNADVGEQVSIGPILASLRSGGRIEDPGQTNH